MYPAEYTDYINILKAEREGEKIGNRVVFQTSNLVEQYLSTASLCMGWSLGKVSATVHWV